MSPIFNYARTLHNIELFEEQEVFPGTGIFFALDNQGFGRLHNGKIYMGYVYYEYPADRFRVEAWYQGKNVLDNIHLRTYYRKTKWGANLSLKRRAMKIVLLINNGRRDQTDTGK